MEDMVFSAPVTFALVFFLGFLGYRIFKLLHIPGGAIAGALVIVALVTSQGVGWAELPSYMSTFCQVILGIMIGCKFSREKVRQIKSLLVPGMLVATWMICISLVIGILMARVTELDLGTALFGSVPGGISEMGLVALSYNLSVPVVTLFQFVRVLAVYFCLPSIVLKYDNTEREEAADKALPIVDKPEYSKKKAYYVLVTILLGTVSGFTANALGVPVGGLLGAMVIVAILRIMGVPLEEVPRWAFILAQVGLGAFLGTTFTPDIVVTLQGLLLPTLVFSIIIVLNGVVLGLLVHRVFGWDLVTSLLATAAAGASQMSAIALDMDADAITVSIIQAMRLALILMLMPTIITLIIR